jgi:hypothetical protein
VIGRYKSKKKSHILTKFQKINLLNRMDITDLNISILPTCLFIKDHVGINKKESGQTKMKD